jgi:hypothetical protein
MRPSAAATLALKVMDTDVQKKIHVKVTLQMIAHLSQYAPKLDLEGTLARAKMGTLAMVTFVKRLTFVQRITAAAPALQHANRRAQVIGHAFALMATI